jgi:transposase
METLPSNEELQSADLRRLFDEYQVQRDNIVWPNDDIPDLYDRIWTDTGLFDKELLDQAPEVTIIIPLDIQNEPLQGTLHTLHAIHNAATNLGPVEIMLWANYEIPDEIMSSDEFECVVNERHSLSTAKLENLIERIKLEGFDTNRFRIRVALDFMNEPANMNDVRSNYMEAVAYDAVQRGFGADHKVIWFDADMTYIHRDALAELCSMLDSGLYQFVKANMLFTSELNDLPLSERSEPAKAAAVFAIAHRMIQRIHPSKDYIDECGLGMTIGEYLRVKGLLQDSHEREHNAESFCLFTHAFWIRNAQGIGDKEILGHVPRAKIGTSNRKIRHCYEHSDAINLVRDLEVDPPDTLLSPVSSNPYKTYVKSSTIDKLDPLNKPHIFVPEDLLWKMISDISALRYLPRPSRLITSWAHSAGEAAANQRIESYGHKLDTEVLQKTRQAYRILSLLIKRCGFTYTGRDELEKESL